MKDLTHLAYFCIVLYALQACAPNIIQRPIPFDQERVDLSLEYMKQRYEIEAETPSIHPKMVVVHWTAIPTFEKSWGAFKNSRIPGFREALTGASALNVSSHYLIDRDGSIYQLLPDTVFARHVIGLNHSAIGIENVGGSKAPLTQKQFRANFLLIKKLMHKHDIDYVIGHHEYQEFRNHPLWMETDPNYLTTKSDPGDEFMNRLRKKLGKASGPPSD